jgi:long-chain acyl-CoA synthetase
VEYGRPLRKDFLINHLSNDNKEEFMMIITKGLMVSAKNQPNKLAIVDGKHRYTYGEFAERTAKLKKSLENLGVQKGDRVALLMLNNFRYLELLYGITAIGAIAVPLNFRLSAPEIVFQLHDAEAKVLFIHQEFMPYVAPLKDKVPSIKHYVLAEDREVQTDLTPYEELLDEQEITSLTYDALDEEDVAGLFYTSGTTGRSKGVMLTHKNLVSNAYHAAISLQYNPDTNYLHVGPMFHLADGASTFAVTLVGGTHSHVRAFTPKIFLQALETDRPNVALLVPTMINMVVNEPEFDKYDTSSLEKIVYGASPMPVEVLKKAAAKFPKLQFNQGYGMTEASPLLTILSTKDHVINGTEQDEKRLTSCGKNIVGVEVRVVDGKGNDVLPGQVGEVIARGPNIMKGYWKLREETNAVLRDGWYYSGDMATVDEEQFIYIVDRKKDMIITGGENVYSVEVENVIYTHPDVIEAAVIGIPDEKWGEVVMAVVVKKPESTLTEKDVIVFIKPELANYKVPKVVTFVEQIPKSGAGKMLKRVLRDEYWQGTKRNVN